MGIVTAGAAAYANIGGRAANQMRSLYNNLIQQGLNAQLTDAGNQVAQQDIQEGQQQAQAAFQQFGQGGLGADGGAGAGDMGLA